MGQKQSHSSYMARGALHPMFGCPYTHFLSQLTSSFHERKYYSWQNRRWGDRWWNKCRDYKYVRGPSSCRMSIDYQCTMALYASIRKIVWHQPVQLPLHCRWWNTKTTSELSNAHLFKHIFMHILSSQWHELLTCGPHSSACPPWTNRVHTYTQTHLHSGDSQWQWS